MTSWSIRMKRSVMTTLVKESPGTDHWEKTTHWKPEGAKRAPSYLYADETKCDQQMETFLKCIEAAGGSSEDGFSAVKMTALGRPQFLLQFSEVLVKWRCFFNFLAARLGKDGKEALDQKLDLEELQSNIGSFLCDGRLHSSGVVDILDWNRLIDERSETSDLLVVPNLQTGQLEPLLSRFSEEEERQLQRMLQRLDVLAKHAVDHGVRLMVDAEQTYFQPAISRLTVETQRAFNRDEAVVFNTYQCYLKEAFDNVATDVELSRREGWCFGAKLVRGAYMYQERARADEIGYEDPINPDYESTNTMMNELGLDATDKTVCFGQLLGMCDQISFPLAQAGFAVFKYVPYGPVSEVMPYLSRRVQENRGFMRGAQMERELLWKELVRRLTSLELLHVPAV
ncbi:hypothetical protein DNTS_034153 [Danionella cerebrum]|uniref:Proline dehydrogenase n=1 Tax=Danionella cerebrum TaxID=2873325 RepID=A0A553N0C1_9TELE|nr:hypothetical protein DNTS_034153 [Danionella translucida]